METVSHDLAEVRQIVLEGLAGYAVHVYLFGSCRRGTENLTSDIDIAVLPLEPLPPWVLSIIRDKLEESQVLRRVDLVDLSMMDSSFRERVMQEGIRWSESENG
jgi:predicted nucleotidyltransferase